MLKFALILVALFITVGAVFVFKARVSSVQEPLRAATVKDNAPVYSELRHQVLTGSRAKFGLGPAPSDSPAWGVLMETGFPEGNTATLISLSDGSASLYLSGGGGLIGGSGHEDVRRAAIAFVRLAGQQQPNLTVTTTFPLPHAGRTVFYVLTDSGVFSAEADVDTLGNERHKLSPLFDAGQDVITRLWGVSKLK